MLGSALLRDAPNHPALHVLAPGREDLDLFDHREVGAFLGDHAIDLVIHGAAKVGGIQANVMDPTGFFVDNVKLAIGVIEGALSAGVDRLLFLGSSCMYPKDYDGVLKEEYLLASPLEETNEGYALGKIVGARYCEYASRQFGVSYHTIIPCNLYGPEDRFDPTSSHLVAACINKVLEAKRSEAPTVEIWGDGKARREFLYVEDLARFILDVCRNGSLPQYLNVGFGEDAPVNFYYETAAAVVGYEGEFSHDLDKPTGMKRKLLDSSKARELGWSPSTSLEVGMRRTVDWFLELEG